MRLNVVKSKNRKFYRIIETVPQIGGGQKTVNLENLGSDLVLWEKFPGRESEDVARERLAELKREKAQEEFELLPKLSSSKRIPVGRQVAFQGGYLFFYGNRAGDSMLPRFPIQLLEISVKFASFAGYGRTLNGISGDPNLRSLALCTRPPLAGE